MKSEAIPIAQVQAPVTQVQA
jgi:hypothetical protein